MGPREPGRKPFIVYKRKLKRGKAVYYVRYRLPDGTRLPGRSTGQTSKDAAEAWAWNHIDSGRVVRKNATVAEFAGSDFFHPAGRWATSKLSRGLRLSDRTCAEKTTKLQKYIIPALGGYQLTGITKRVVTDFRNELHCNGLSSDTINKILDCLRAILEDAEDSGLITAVPKIERAAGRAVERGVLTRAKVVQLFSIEWKDARACTCNALAASSGLRLGECLGLRASALRERSVLVCRSYGSVARTLSETTKTRVRREVVVPVPVRSEMRRLLSICPHQIEDPFVFWAARASEHPMDYKLVRQEFYRALDQIGIGEAERKVRNISFHSHRHFFNSMLLDARIPAEKVCRLTGHTSAAMTEHYAHFDDFGDVEALQAGLFHGGL